MKTACTCILLIGIYALTLTSGWATLWWDAGSTTATGGSGTWDASLSNWTFTAADSTPPVSPWTNTTWSVGQAAFRNSSAGQVTTVTLDQNVTASSLWFGSTSAGATAGGSITLEPSLSNYSLSLTPTGSNMIYVSGTLSPTTPITINTNLNIVDPNAGSAQQLKIYGNINGSFTVNGNINISGSTAGYKSLVFDTGTGNGTMTYSGSTTTSPGGTATMGFEFGAASTGNGTYVVNGANTAVSGTIKLNRGTVIVNNSSALGTAAANQVQLGGGADTTNSPVTALVTGTSGVTVVNNMYVQNTVATHVVGGQHTSGVSTFSGSISMTSGALSVTSANGGVTDFAGPISASANSYALTKIGGGVVRFNRAAGNTYRGATAVNEGMLLVNNTSGTGLGLGAVTVGTGTSVLASLGGTGTVTSAITINGGGSITPGNIDTTTLISQVGTFHAAAGLTWNSDGSHAGMLLNLGVNTAASDQLDITGAFTQGTGSSYLLSLTDAGGLSLNTTYTLITFDSTTFSSASVFGLDQTTLTSGINGTFDLTGSELTFTVTSVPEPTPLACVALALGLMWWVSRRRSSSPVLS